MICTNVTCKDRKYISFLLLKVKKIFIFLTFFTNCNALFWINA